MRRFLMIVFGLLLCLAVVCAGKEGATQPATQPASSPTSRPANIAKLLRVLTPVNTINQIVQDNGRLWLATAGGVTMLDRTTGKWRFYTRHDGLASNYVTSVSVHNGRFYAFHGISNQVSILDDRSDRWDVKLLGEKPQRGFWGGPWRDQQVRTDGIWCLFTGLPDTEFGTPSVIELQQYDLTTFRLLKSVNVQRLLPEVKPNKAMDTGLVGLAFVDGNAWIATRDHLVKVDCKTWQAQVVSLPPEAVWNHVYDGHQGKQELPNRIQCIVAGDKCLWLGLEAGLATVDPTTGKFSFVLVRDEKPYRAIGVIVPQDRNLWFAGPNGPICRMDLKTEKIETIAAGPLGSIHQLVVLDGEAWVAAGRPEGASRVDLKTGKVTTIKQETFLMPGNVLDGLVLLEHILCGWDYRQVEKNGKEEMIGGIQTFDLSTGKNTFYEFQEPALMIPYKNRIWLVSYNSVTPFFPLEGKLGRAVGSGAGSLAFSRSPEIVAKRDGKLYLLTHSFEKDAKDAYGEQLSVFEPKTGKLELLFVMPEEWRSHNAMIMGVTSGDVYLTYQDDGEHFKRFELAKKTWVDLPRKGERFDQVCESLGQTWWGSHDKLQSFSGSSDAPSQQYQLPGHHINRLEASDDGNLEVVTQAVVLRYDGKTWQARPLPSSGPMQAFEGKDRAGNPTGRYAIRSWQGGPEVAIYQGKPSIVLANEAKLPVTVDADGTIHVPVPKAALRELRLP